LERANGSDSKYWSSATSKREDSVAEPLLKRVLRRIFNVEKDGRSAQCPRCDIKPYVKVGFLQSHLSNQHGEYYSVGELENLLRHRVSPGQLQLAGRFRFRAICRYVDVKEAAAERSRINRAEGKAKKVAEKEATAAVEKEKTRAEKEARRAEKEKEAVQKRGDFEGRKEKNAQKRQ
jgi:hypothetical protein